MPPDLSIIAVRPLRTLLRNYPNCYIPMSDAASDANYATRSTMNAFWRLPADTDDQPIALTLNAVGLDQWEDPAGSGIIFGDYSSPVSNTDKCAFLARSIDPIRFDSIFNPEGSASLWMLGLVAKVSWGVSSLLSLGHNTTQVIDVRTDGSNKFLCRYNGVNTISNIAVAFNNNVLACYVDRRINGTNEVSIYNYNAGTKVTTAVVDTQSLSASSAASMSTNDRFAIHARWNDPNFDRFPAQITQVPCRSYRARVINFGTTPPNDITEVIEEFAANALIGLARDW